MTYRVLYYGCVSPPSRRLKAAIERRLSAAPIRPIHIRLFYPPFYLQRKPKVIQQQSLDRQTNYMLSGGEC